MDSGIVWQIVTAVIAILVMGLVMTYGMDIMESEHEDICPSTDTFFQANNIAGTNSTANPVTGGMWGCCEETWNSTDCKHWRTDNYAVNASFESLSATENISDKQETLTNVIVAVVIITLLIGGFGAFAMTRR